MDTADLSERSSIFIMNGLRGLQAVTQTILSPLRLPIHHSGKAISMLRHRPVVLYREA